MTKVSGILAAAALAVAFAASPAFAQQAQTQRVMGTISGIDGSAIVVKTKDAELKVNLTDKRRGVRRGEGGARRPQGRCVRRRRRHAAAGRQPEGDPRA